MNIEEYLFSVETVARKSLDLAISPQDLIMSPGDQAALINDCIECRASLLTPDEEKDLEGYLEIGYFNERTERQRLAAFAFCFEVQRTADLLSIRSHCAQYTKEQKLFVGEPTLFDRIRTRKSNGRPDLELIDLSAVKSISGTELYKTDNGFAKLSPYLNPGIVKWAHDNHPSSPIFIRLNPHEYHHSQPSQLLCEATLVPANPKWLANIDLPVGKKEFAAYCLLDKPAAEAPAEFWDYHIRKLRKLEVHARRRERTYLSMTIEELSAPDEAQDFMSARCIHLDTFTPIGTALHEVRISHLDLALNVYCKKDSERRFENTLQNGKAQDATFRTHLFRIEDIPFVALFTLCQMFLRSRILLNEWFEELSGTAARSY